MFLQEKELPRSVKTLRNKKAAGLARKMMLRCVFDALSMPTTLAAAFGDFACKRDIVPVRENTFPRQKKRSCDHSQ